MSNQVDQQQLRFILAFRWIFLTASGWTIGKFFSFFAITAMGFPFKSLDIGFALSGLALGSTAFSKLMKRIEFPERQRF